MKIRMYDIWTDYDEQQLRKISDYIFIVNEKILLSVYYTCPFFSLQCTFHYISYSHFMPCDILQHYYVANILNNRKVLLQNFRPLRK
jgi:hypothetical protein